MNVALIYASDTGQILSSVSFVGEGCPLDAPMGCTIAVADKHPALPAYWDGSAPRPVPPAPSPSHTWDWPSKSWVLSLAAAKDAKWAKVKAARDAREFGTFRWNGYDFDGDRDAQRRLTVALEAAKEAIAAGADFSTFWKLADNTVMTLSAQDVVDVYRACGEHNIRDNHAIAAVKYAQIQAATTIEALDSI